MSGRDYLKNSIRIVEHNNTANFNSKGLSTRNNTPMDLNNKPEIDITQLLTPKMITNWNT